MGASKRCARRSRGRWRSYGCPDGGRSARGRRAVLMTDVRPADARHDATIAEQRTRSSLGRGARILPVAIAVTGLVTYAYLGLASHALNSTRYGYIALLWSAVFITTSILYRPVEQLLSRTTADRAERGLTGNRYLWVATRIQLALALVFVVVALALHDTLEHNLFGHSAALYWILVVAVLAY